MTSPETPSTAPQLPPQRSRPDTAHLVALVAAFGTGGLLAFMVLLNGTLSRSHGPLFASWTAHATGTVAASLFLLPFAVGVLRNRHLPGAHLRAPLWAYLGGVCGAVTVMLSAVTMNTALALSGTLALGLLGQVAFGLLADRFGLLGLPRRAMTARDAAALVLILTGSALIIFSGRIGAALDAGFA